MNQQHSTTTTTQGKQQRPFQRMPRHHRRTSDRFLNHHHHPGGSGSYHRNHQSHYVPQRHHHHVGDPSLRSSSFDRFEIYHPGTTGSGWNYQGHTQTGSFIDGHLIYGNFRQTQQNHQHLPTRQAITRANLNYNPSYISGPRQFVDPRLVQSSSMMGSPSQYRRVYVRHLDIDEYFNRQNNTPTDNTNFLFQQQDDVLVLQLFPPPTAEDIQLALDDIASSEYNQSVAEERIRSSLKIRTHISSRNLSSYQPSSLDEEHEICVVCQAEYEHEEKIGGLRCGHEYHVECIKKWLKKKNVCPICKAKAYEPLT